MRFEYANTDFVIFAYSAELLDFPLFMIISSLLETLCMIWNRTKEQRTSMYKASPQPVPVNQNETKRSRNFDTHDLIVNIFLDVKQRITIIYICVCACSLRQTCRDILRDFLLLHFSLIQKGFLFKYDWRHTKLSEDEMSTFICVSIYHQYHQYHLLKKISPRFVPKYTYVHSTLCREWLL